MKCLIVIPHVFEPKSGSLYSSQQESKRENKQKALEEATIGNIRRHNGDNYIHASLGKNQKVVTRRIDTTNKIDLEIQIYTNMHTSLVEGLPQNKKLKIHNIETDQNLRIPGIASQKLLEQCEEYDILSYMEDDILIEDPEFFSKIKYFHEILPQEYTILPHRCEHINGGGDVILSGDPDGGRADLFWDTKETIGINWPTAMKTMYRATNPHSGCFFISRAQAKNILESWQKRNWQCSFELSGPLEQAGSGRLLEYLKIMKPIPSEYKFFMVRHLDDLWKRHSFET